jgi:hypothetical protein
MTNLFCLIARIDPGGRFLAMASLCCFLFALPTGREWAWCLGFAASVIGYGCLGPFGALFFGSLACIIGLVIEDIERRRHPEDPKYAGSWFRSAILQIVSRTES